MPRATPEVLRRDGDGAHLREVVPDDVHRATADDDPIDFDPAELLQPLVIRCV